jgi:hypothetical protein
VSAESKKKEGAAPPRAALQSGAHVDSQPPEALVLIVTWKATSADPERSQGWRARFHRRRQ